MNAIDLSPIHAEVLDPTTKGYPLSAAPLPLSAIGAQGWSLLAGDLPLPLAVIRDSALAHNHAWMRDFTAATGVKARSGAVWQTRPGLQPALEVWSRVQSVPEPGLAILTMGKRDASYDIEMPIALKRFCSQADTAPRPVPAGWTITAMNDQHAYLRYPADQADPPQVGDLIGCGISHPCTTFDKWRVLFTVDDDYRVSGAIRTYF